MKYLFRFALAALLALGAENAFATVQTLNGVVYSTAPTNSALNTLNFDCVTTGAQCSPLVELSIGGAVLGTGGTGTGLTVTPSSLPLPAGAATSANQTIVQGTAGSPSTTVLTIQGVPNGTPQNVTIVPSSASAAASSQATTSALAASLSVKASAGNLYGFYCSAITGGASGYCIAYNSASPPSAGALTGTQVLDVCYFTSASGCSLSRIPMPRQYSSGIQILVSSATTPYTYTTGSLTAFISADYQ